MFASRNPKCSVCQKTVYQSEHLNASGKIFQKLCFRCNRCHLGLKVHSFTAVAGANYCIQCVPKSSTTAKQEVDEEIDYNPVENMFSNDVLEWALAKVESEIAEYKSKRKEVPDELETRKTNIEIKIQILSIQVQTEQLTEEAYVELVQQKIAEEKELTKKYSSAGNKEAALLALTRAKIMTKELEEEGASDDIQVKTTLMRGAIRGWMENHQFDMLQQWLAQSRNQLAALFTAGEVPVVGWSQLAETIKNAEPFKRKLEAEVDENARERQAVALHIKNLLVKQEELEQKNKELQSQIKQMEQMDRLKADSNAIAMLANREAASVAKVEGKMKNNYFVDYLDSDDVSTVFSMFKMDALFANFKKNDTDNNLGVTRTTPIVDLQNNLELNFSEAAELLWKLNLLEKGEKGVELHLEKCSICRTTKLAALLREYGMQEADSKAMAEKMKDWKGYCLATVNGASVALALGLAANEKAKLATCLMKIQRAHQWSYQD